MRLSNLGTTNSNNLAFLRARRSHHGRSCLIARTLASLRRSIRPANSSGPKNDWLGGLLCEQVPRWRRRKEKTRIYQGRSVPRELAEQLAADLHANDRLETQPGDELGHSKATRARPLEAAASAIGVTSGGWSLFPGMLGWAAPGLGWS